MRVGARALVPALVLVLLGALSAPGAAKAPSTPEVYEPALFTPVVLATPTVTAVPLQPLVTTEPTEPPRATPTPKPTPRPTPRPKPVVRPVTRGGVVGAATYYCNFTHVELKRSRCMAIHPDVGGDQMYAAAGPALRVALGGNAGSSCPCPWRGRIVTVTAANGHAVKVILADWCACGAPHVIDLYGDPFAILAKWGSVQPVRITWAK